MEPSPYKGPRNNGDDRAIRPLVRGIFGLVLASHALPRPLAVRPPLPPGAAEAAGLLGAAGGAPTLGAWLVSLVPTNPIAAAANGQIVH